MTDRRLPGGASSDRYVVERTLGRGGMASVYLARDQSLDRLVALKVLAEHLADDDVFRDRFLREGRLAAKFVHPNVVRVYDVGEDERGPFIVMEYVEGETLADELQRRGRLPATEVVSVGIQVCSALEAAHAERLVHRDIKPQNILRGPDGHVKIADFGIARSLAGTHHTEIGTVLGTAAYLSPEQARGDRVTAAADIYSLGVVVYELLTGQTPFNAETLPELVLKREQGAITPPSELAPGVPAGLETVVLRCLALRPEDRPASAAVLANELAGSSDEPVTELLPLPADLRATEVLPLTAATTPLRLAGKPRRRFIAALVVAASLLAVAVILAVALADSGSGKPTATVTTTPGTTTQATTATTTRNQLPPTTPQQAIADTRIAINDAQAHGQLDQGAAGGLNNQLDSVAQALATGASQAAAQQTAALLQQLATLTADGQLSSTGFAQLSRSLNELAALLPPVQVNPGPPANGHGHGNGRGHD
ncbi:MAG TPA: protein kinase [Gaiellaceae bacterium]|nr:protein kinase [Gaiellaceae bacterium]